MYSPKRCGGPLRDRARFLGDPDFNPDMPVKRLVSKPYAAQLRTTINLSRASKSDSTAFGAAYLPRESEETTHLSVMDGKGNAVSLTYTLEYGYGSRIVADGTGFLLNNEMGDFNPVPGVTNTRGMIGTPPQRGSSRKADAIEHDANDRRQERQCLAGRRHARRAYHH